MHPWMCVCVYGLPLAMCSGGDVVLDVLIGDILSGLILLGLV